VIGHYPVPGEKVVAECFEMVHLRSVICDLDSPCLTRKGHASKGDGTLPVVVKGKAEVVGERSHV
jgi:hypothetical protein